MGSGSGGCDSRARRSFRIAGTFAALLAVLLASGSHWVALQAVAFGSMIVRYSREGPLHEALSRTFDGQHPCPLCHAVQQGQQEQQEKRSLLGLDSRFELSLPAPGVALLPRLGGFRKPAWPLAMAGPSRAHPPPKPPPRFT